VDYKIKYQEWLDSPYVDKGLKHELKEIQDSEEEIKERFYKDLEFGTGGMRGILGAGTNRMNQPVVGKAIQGLASFIKQSGVDNMSCVIAYDSRHQSREFSELSASILAAGGVKTYIFDGIRSTPELSHAVRELKCTAGIMFTASHNPRDYNGFKVYWDYGCQMLPEMAEELIRHIEKIDFSDIESIGFEEGLVKKQIIILSDDIDDIFIEKVKHTSIKKSVDKNLKIVYTPLHGTGTRPVMRVLKEMGFRNVFPVTEQLIPDPNFSTVEYPNPEDEKAFEKAYIKANEVKGDIVIANDPDCDRIGVAVNTGDQTYQLLTGNQVGPLLIDYILKTRKEQGSLPNNPYVIKTIVTSELGRVVAEYHGVNCIDTLTGFKYIGEIMEENAKKGTLDFIFGYEESIGYTIGDFVRDKDAVTATLMVCEMAAYYKSKDMTLLDALDKLHKRHGYYVDTLKSINMEGMAGEEQIAKIMSEFRTQSLAKLGEKRVVSKYDYLAETAIDYVNHKDKPTGLPKSDVLKFNLEDGSWFVLRPSGTEPKIKIYFSTVHRDEKTAQEVSKSMMDSVLAIIDQI
jgi:phosphoglucomutase